MCQIEWIPWAVAGGWARSARSLVARSFSTGDGVVLRLPLLSKMVCALRFKAISKMRTWGMLVLLDILERNSA